MLPLFFQSSRFTARKKSFWCFPAKTTSIYRQQKLGKAAIISIYHQEKFQKDAIISIYRQQKSQKCNVFFNQLDLPPANVFFFGGEGGGISSRLIKSESRKNSISESKIKIIARNHTHDHSKQMVINIFARNLKLLFQHVIFNSDFATESWIPIQFYNLNLITRKYKAFHQTCL